MLFHSPGRAMASPMPSRMVWILLMAALLAALAASGALIVGTQGLLGPNDALDPAPAAALMPTACDPTVALRSGDIATVAGGVISSATGDGGAALQARLFSQYATLALDSLGDVYFFDRLVNEIRRVTTDGVISKYPGPNGVADSAVGVAMDSRDDLLVADNAGHRIWQVAPDGSITSVAGTGKESTAIVPGPADQTPIGLSQVAWGPDGSLYFDGGNTFGQVTPEGMIRLFAGTGTPGFSGDGDLAVKARLSNEIEAVAVDAAGNVYLGDTDNHRIRKVDPAGVITTFAGNGDSAWAGDGGHATAASLGLPIAVAVDRDGTVYVSDQGTSTVRKIATDGIITTIAGTGKAGFSGDCGPGSQAQLSAPIRRGGARWCRLHHGRG